jgi:exoribonuclease R
LVEVRTSVPPVPDIDPPLAALRAELKLPAAFPADVLAEASAATWQAADRVDATDIEFVTVDPPGSRDLDQAFQIERQGAGHRVRYAIADVGAFVRPDGALDAEAHRRGETVYLPDGRVPLHPPVLSEGTASLLPGEDRPAVLWQLDLDADGELTAVDVRRSVVRSRAQLDYQSLQASKGEVFELLREVGERRLALERARGGVSLPVPEQQVEGDGTAWTLTYRATLPVEDWNAQLSLLTGMAAAKLMLDAGVGLLRTMPPPAADVVATLRRSALALGVSWPSSASYPEVIRGLDGSVPAHAAVLRLASVLFRGAGYVAFDGSLPAQRTHSAVAAPYAHATAPLRRLADRYVSECCLAACAGVAVPEWARTGLPALPRVMAEADQRAHAADRGVIDIAETLVLQHRVGEVFRGVVVEASAGRGEVQLTDPAVRGRLRGDALQLGAVVDVRVSTADVVARRVEFTAIAGDQS